MKNFTPYVLFILFSLCSCSNKEKMMQQEELVEQDIMLDSIADIPKVDSAAIRRQDSIRIANERRQQELIEANNKCEDKGIEVSDCSFTFVTEHGTKLKNSANVFRWSNYGRIDAEITLQNLCSPVGRPLRGNLYIQVMNSNGDVLGYSGTFYDSNGDMHSYTMETSIDTYDSSIMETFRFKPDFFAQGYKYYVHIYFANNFGTRAVYHKNYDFEIL